jgi:outer membrane protein OmpA-like peptidoglycan-associated protein
MKIIPILVPLGAIALLTGCATTVPSELTDARAAYNHASNGPAAHMAPAELHKAKDALTLAENSFVQDSDSYKTKDLAYVAQRKAQLADAVGVMATDKATKAKAEADFQEKQGQMVKQGKQDLSDAEKMTASALADVKQGKSDLTASQKQTAEAEKRTAEAEAALAKLAAVKEEERGLVVTLSGSVLFQSAQSNLLASAREKLNQVATALMAVKERNIIIEGHTDSQGSDAYNDALSQRRAEAVRHYLINQGYPSDKIQARGMGETSPIADNASPEGRANNRRVEIVIQHESSHSGK